MKKIYNKCIRRYILILVCLLSITVIFTIFSKTVTSSVKSSLLLCVSAIIPSLFPFMVLSSLISRITAYIIPSESNRFVWIIPFVLGALCGFPVGASSVALLYENNVLTKRKAEHLAALCNNTGPAFIISVIGADFWHNPYLGIMFYICQISASVLVYLVWEFILGKRISSDTLCNPGIIPNKNERDFSFSAIFCESVTGASASLIHVCGYIIFFKIIYDIISEQLLNSLSSVTAKALIASLLEFSSGALVSADLGGIYGIMICGFAIGFSGLSVMAQSASFLHKSELSFLPLLKFKFYAGCMTALLSGICYSNFEFTKPVFTNLTLRYPSKFAPILSTVLLFLPLCVKFVFFLLKLIHKTDK